jgi:DNA-directed RNA polymerase alpha subunit
METSNLREQLILLIMESELKHFRIEDITDWRIAKIHSVVNKLMNPSDKFVESEKIPLDASVKVIGLPKQFENFLIDVKEVETIGQLLELRMDDFTRMRNFGRTSMIRLTQFLNEHNLKLKDA